MSSSTPDPRPGGNRGPWGVNRFAIGVLIGAIAAIIGFLIAWFYLLLR